MLTGGDPSSGDQPVKRVQKNPRAEIVSIGEELLGEGLRGGNAEYLAGRLSRLGFRVRVKTTVGDDLDEIGAVLTRAVEKMDCVIATGGLGPTGDDQTLEAVTLAFQAPLRHSESIYRRLLGKRQGGRPVMARALRRQSRIPDGFVPLPNPHGTAPGLIRKGKEGILVLLPGVPQEMKGIFEASVHSRLARSFPALRPNRSRVLKIVGVPEPRIDRLAIQAFRAEGQGIPTVLAGCGCVEVHLGQKGRAATRRIEIRMRGKLGIAVYGVDDDTLAEVVGRLLRQGRQSLAVAESCTGGMLGEMITSVPGASRYFLGGVIAYGKRAKLEMLTIREDDLRRHGAISSRLAAAMAKQSRLRFSASLGLGITGIAGPGGGSRRHPVGEVFIGLSWKEGARAVRYRFRGAREPIRRRACVAALDLVRRRLILHPGKG